MSGARLNRSKSLMISLAPTLNLFLVVHSTCFCHSSFVIVIGGAAELGEQRLSGLPNFQFGYKSVWTAHVCS